MIIFTAIGIASTVGVFLLLALTLAFGWSLARAASQEPPELPNYECPRCGAQFSEAIGYEGRCSECGEPLRRICDPPNGE